MRSANDTLSALFLADDPDEVLAAAAAVPALTSGRIHHAETFNRRTGKPEKSGLYCARTFGPVDADRCLCGKLTAPTHTGQTCDKCGVLCGASHLRGERWGRIDVAVGLVHPRLAPRIARALGCSARDLQRVAAFDAELHEGGRITAIESFADAGGLERIAQLLGDRADELLLRHVPLTPPAWRGTRRDPQDHAYAAFLGRCNRLDRLIELGAPQIILSNEQRLTQETFDRVYTAVRAELSARGPLVVATSTPRARSLLQAVHDDPDSDAARRAYAAHLTAEGDLRGEFITRQLADPRRVRPTTRESDLLRRDFDRYLAPLGDVIDPAGVGFRRGFLASCRPTAAAASRVDDPAWSTVERLETDLVDLIASPALRSLCQLVIPWRTLRALCLAGVDLPRVHTVQLDVPRAPPPDAGDVADPPIFPGLRSLTVVHRSRRGASDWTWLPASRLLPDLERLTVTLSIVRLDGLDLAWWTRLFADHPRLASLTLVFDKRHVQLELRRDREWCTLRATLSRRLVEEVSMGHADHLEHLTRALTTIGPHDVMSVRIAAPGAWLSDELAAAYQALRDHFGAALVLPHPR